LELNGRILKNFDNYVGAFAGIQEGQQSGKSYLMAMRKNVPALYCSFCRPFNDQDSAHGIPKFTFWKLNELYIS
jgi:hypothetical protein